MARLVLLAIGTRKGLWLAVSRDDRVSWAISGPHYPMTESYAVAIDRRRRVPRLLAAVTSEHFGPSVVTSDDLGESWQEPDRAPVAFPSEAGAVLTRVWQLAPGPANQPEVSYAGTEPSALFRSTDGGATYELGAKPVGPSAPRALDTRRRWHGGAHGAAASNTSGGHRDRQRTDDGASTWRASNKGIRAPFLPDQYPEFGQCVHKVAQHPGRSDQLFLQNHHGVYRSDDLGASWQSIAEGLPSDFGFPIVVHPHRPGVVYNFPLSAAGRRFPPDGSCAVYRSEDAGSTWTALTDGLPRGGFWSAVLRDAFCADDAEPAGLYFGSRSGEVYASRDEGDTWGLVAQHLPDVLCLRAAVI